MDTLFTIHTIRQVAATYWQQYRHRKTWALHGELGAGKTTFVHALCDVLQVADTVSSPTFSIINEYKSAVEGTIFHMDWYRLRDEEEAIQAGVEDCLSGGHFCMIEWPGRAPGLLPYDTLHICLETIDAHTRKILTNISCDNG